MKKIVYGHDVRGRCFVCTELPVEEIAEGTIINNVRQYVMGWDALDDNYMIKRIVSETELIVSCRIVPVNSLEESYAWEFVK